FFLRTGAIAVRGGMPEASALRALTLEPARMMHLDHRVGSLAPGKDADFVVLSGAPFSAYTQVLQTYIDGVLRFDRTRQRDWSPQAGGSALFAQDRLPPAAPLVPPLPAVKVPAAPDKAPTLRRGAKEYAVLAGRIHTVANGTITDGVVLVKDGKVSA